ncbi:substrate-binding domain-containing protein [Natronococcus roseus]|uniref:substrate-binding domain-containing protein n=1 Tax=Natronococcus roseus TaxID=1052014 RepID=UPI00374D148E
MAATGGLGIAGLAGCLGEEDDVDADDAGGEIDDYEIRYIPHASAATDPFWETQELGWEAAVDQLGIEASFQGPREEDYEEQVDNIEAAIDAGVDALAVTLPDPGMFEGALERAEEEGIFVTVANVTEDEQSMPWNGYIGQDESDVGSQLATETLSLFEETTGSIPVEVVIANHSPGHGALETRQEGIETVLDDEGVTHDWVDIPEGDPAGVISTLESHKASNEDVELVYTLGPSGGEPAVDWLQDEGYEGEVFHAGVDMSGTLADAIGDGMNLGQIIQQPFLQGYLAAQYLTNYLVYGILPPEHTPTGPTFVSEENLETVERQIEEVGVA